MTKGGVSDLEKLLGQRIQSARRASGLTQQQLCHQAGISYSTLTKIERGAIKSPSVFTVSSIAAAIGTSVDKLVGNGHHRASNRQLKTSDSGIRFVYFDVNGCLVRFQQRAFTKIAAQFQIPTDIVETAFWHYNDEACRGGLTMADFNKKLAEKIGVKAIDWSEYYLETAESVPEAAELIKLTHKYYLTGLMTNIMPGLLTSLRRAGQIPELDYDAVIDSSEIGHVKPEAKVYEIAEAKAGVKPGQILLIDDTRGNLSAAERAGWRVLWFDYADPQESVEHVKQSLGLN